MLERPPDTAVLCFNVDTRAGMEGQARRIATGLAARGARVTFVSTRFGRGLGGLPDRPLLERRDGVEVARVPFAPWFYWDSCLDLYEAVADRFLRSRRRATEVILATPLVTGVIAARIGARSGTPVVIRLACGGEYGDVAGLLRSSDRERAVRDLSSATRLVCLSREIEDEVLGLGIPSEKLARIANGVPRARFALPRRPSRDLLFMGRLSAQKRVPVLLRAFASVASSHRDARLLIAGEGEDAARCRELARELHLDGQVQFLGVRDDVPALLARARAFVLPSASEGHSNSLLEALAAGAPVIASNTPGNAELLDSEHGLLVPVDDEPALARALDRVLGDDLLADRLSRAARERARVFDHDAALERLADVLAEAKSSRTPRHTAHPPPSLEGLALRGITRVVRNAARKLFCDA